MSVHLSTHDVCIEKIYMWVPMNIYTCMYEGIYLFIYYEFEIYVRGTLVEISGNLRKSRGNLEEIWVSRTIDLKFVVPSKVVYEGRYIPGIYLLRYIFP